MSLAVDRGVLIVGAGVAGLACGAELAQRGVSATLLEKSRGVGGRCATRRVNGQPVDHGVAFLHGDDEDFLAALDAIPAARLEGWPRVVRGAGTPCRPAAFRRHRRMAFVDGLTVFPKALAAGLDVRRRRRAVAVRAHAGRLAVDADDGSRRETTALVLALPPPQSDALLAGLVADVPEIAAARALLDNVGTVPCLTVLAGYPADTPAPGWDMAFPEDSAILQLISHDSSKRDDPASRVLVLQGRAGWSRARWNETEEGWPTEALAEAGRLVGDWVTRPAWVQTQRWRHAQVSRTAELTGPLLFDLPGGARLGITGDGFGWGGGVQAAWRAGRGLARRLVGERHEWT